MTVSRCTGNDVGRMYIDGNVVSTFVPRLGDLSNAKNLRIGRRYPISTVVHFMGCLDELEIFKRELAVAELDRLWTAGWAGKCCPADPDEDLDLIGDLCDNCPGTGFNPDQSDSDGDGVGDACDDCPQQANADQKDADGDGTGDPCEGDDPDGDGIPDALDRCPRISDPAQTDSDGDGAGDACDLCPSVPTPEQTDADGDGAGDGCDLCPTVFNPEQTLLVFGQTIAPVGRIALAWGSAEDVAYVKGDLAGVGQYVPIFQGTLPEATSLDVSGDAPAAGRGYYYMVKLATCGSRQSAPGTEPGRDAALP